MVPSVSLLSINGYNAVQQPGLAAYIKHVQDIEGKDKEAIKREESLRKAIKGIIACDITKHPPIAEDHRTIRCCHEHALHL